MSREYPPSPVDPHAKTESLLRGPASGLVIWLLSGLGTLALTIAMSAFGFAWHASDRIARIEEKQASSQAVYEQLRADLRELRTRLDQVLDELRRRP